MTSYEHVGFEATDGIGVLTLDRPSVLNALTEDLLSELAEAIERAFDDPAVRSIVVTGAGRGFCSGGDVTEMRDRDPTKLEWKIHLTIFQNTVSLLREGPKPTIAAINGPAVGAGMDLSLACDFRIMAESAFMRPQFIDIGLLPGDGGAWLLPRLIGESQAKRYLLTNETITPAVASDLGLVYDVVDDDELMAAARSLAETLRDKPALAMAKTIELVNEDQSFEDYCRAVYENQWECIHDDEHREAVRAFVDDREPDFDRDY